MTTTILFIVVCSVFWFLVGLMFGFFLGAVKSISETKQTDKTETHFEPGGFYID